MDLPLKFEDIVDRKEAIRIKNILIFFEKKNVRGGGGGRSDRFLIKFFYDFEYLINWH